MSMNMAKAFLAAIIFASFGFFAERTHAGAAPTINWTWPQAGTTVHKAAGSSLTLQVSASTSSAAPTKYQWLKNGLAITGATTAVYTVSNLSTGGAAESSAQYSVRVYNKFGSKTSGASTVVVGYAPTINWTWPQAGTTVSKTVGSALAVQVSANSSRAMSYQWIKDAVAISGATTTPCTITSSVQPAHAGKYQVIVSNAFGSVTSGASTVEVGSVPSLVSFNPSSATTKNVGESITFSVTASGSDPLSYQWYKESSPIQGANSASYSIASLALSDSARYSVTVSNPYGNFNASVSLSVQNAPAPSPSPSPSPVAAITNYSQIAAIAKPNYSKMSDSNYVIAMSTQEADRKFFQGDSAVQDGRLYYVDGAKGNDANSGSVLAPFKTISKAIRMLSSANLGTASKFNVIINGGIYREMVDFGTSALAGTSIPVVLQGAAGQTVLIKGSDVVTGWTGLGNGLFSVSRATVTEQVFVDNRMLQQVKGTVFGGYTGYPNYKDAMIAWAAVDAVVNGVRTTTIDPASLGDYQFYQNGSTLYIKLPSSVTSLASGIVEVSARDFVLTTNGVSNITIRNLNFEHSNTTAYRAHAQGAIMLYNGNNLTVDRVSVAFMDGTCISSSGWDTAAGTPAQVYSHTIKNSDISFCGHIGISGAGTNNALVQSNSVSFNNVRGFNNNWASGGMKFAGGGGLVNSVVSDNDIFRNYGDGYWCDFCLTGGNTITGNRIYYNEKYGVHLEVNRANTFSGNYVYGNSAHGLYIRESINQTFDGNFILWHQGYGLSIADVWSQTNGVPDSRCYGKLGARVSGNTVTNNKIAFGNMSGANATNLLQLDWHFESNVSNYNTYINKAGFPWQFYSIVGTASGAYSPYSTVQQNLLGWQSATKLDMNSVKYEKDPTTVILPGDSQTLQQKILNKEPIPANAIEQYFIQMMQ